MKKTTVLLDSPRRRRFPDDFKERVLAEIAQPGVTIAEVARRFDLSQSLIHSWRRKNSELSTSTPSSNPADFACYVREKVEVTPLFARGLRLRLPTGVLIEWSEPVSLEMVAELSKHLGGLT